jgi:hypothetical protein
MSNVVARLLGLCDLRLDETGCSFLPLTTSPHLPLGFEPSTTLNLFNPQHFPSLHGTSVLCSLALLLLLLAYKNTHAMSSTDPLTPFRTQAALAVAIIRAKPQHTTVRGECTSTCAIAHCD